MAKKISIRSLSFLNAIVTILLWIGFAREFDCMYPISIGSEKNEGVRF
ncbi:hypothetical protein NDQ57_08385 [Rossellomorea marisflavi]|nr:hypothetical protein [Rossellomorea marisflavi]MCM2604714.1 hypothetical protein [Rossellomorea marisflavi]